MGLTATTTETFGQKARRMYEKAQLGNTWHPSRPHMRAVLPWQPSVAQGAGNWCVNGGNVYYNVIAGTTAASGGPTGTTLSTITDNTTSWLYFGSNQVTLDPNSGVIVWSALLSVTAGQVLTTTISVYGVVASGTTGSNAPTGTSNSVTDGTATLTYMGPIYQTPYDNVMPAYTYSSSTAPGSLLWSFANGANMGVQRAFLRNGGSGYAVGDTVTLTGGTNTTAAVLQVTAIDATHQTATVSGITTTPALASAYYPSGGNAMMLVSNTNVSAGSGTIFGNVTGSLASSGTLTKATQLFVCEYGFAIVPTQGTTYTNNSHTYTVQCVDTVNRLIAVSGSGSPTTSGTLTLGTGTGDATISFASATAAAGDTTITYSAIAGGAIASVSVQAPGSYTAPPADPAAQGSTSGNGTGANFTCDWGQPFWCKLRGCYNAGVYNTGPHNRIYSYQPANYLMPISQHMAMEFYTDSIVFGINLANGSKQLAGIIIDGVRLSLDGLSANGGASNYHSWDFTNAGGRKIRFIRIEFVSTIAGIAGVYTDTGSIVYAPDDTDRVRCCLLTDSLDAGSTYGPEAANAATSLILGHWLGWNDVWSFSQGGTGYINPGSGSSTSTGPFGGRVAEILSLNPDVIVFFGSTNDAGEGSTTSTVTAMLQQIRAAGSKAVIIVFGLWPIGNASGSASPTTGNYTTMLSLESAVQAGVTAFNDPLGLTTFIPMCAPVVGLPRLTGSYNHNPAPSGVSLSSSSNWTTYVNQGDYIHPATQGTIALGKWLSEYTSMFVLPNLAGQNLQSLPVSF